MRPVPFKRLKRLLDKMTEEVVEADAAGIAARLTLEFSGTFALDRETEAGVGGAASGPLSVPGVTARLEGGVTRRVEHDGDGTMTLTYELSTAAWRRHAD